MVWNMMTLNVIWISQKWFGLTWPTLHSSNPIRHPAPPTAHTPRIAHLENKPQRSAIRNCLISPTAGFMDPVRSQNLSQALIGWIKKGYSGIGLRFWKIKMLLTCASVGNISLTHSDNEDTQMRRPFLSTKFLDSLCVRWLSAGQVTMGISGVE